MEETFDQYKLNDNEIKKFGDDGNGKSFVRIRDTSRFNTNDIEEASSTVTYIGLESSNNKWWIKKIDTSSGNSFQHASVTNNSSYTDYDTAWTNRATLTYENYGDAFNG